MGTADSGDDSQPENRIATINILWNKNQWLYLVAGFMLGVLVWPLIFAWRADFFELFKTLLPEGAGIAFGVFVVDRIYAWRDAARRKADLIRQMRSNDNSTALNALEELREHGWLYDGSLEGQSFRWANLSIASLVDKTLAYEPKIDMRKANFRSVSFEGANFEETILSETSLEEADLCGANLQNARFRDANLCKAQLHGARLSGALLIGANLNGAMVSDWQLSQAGWLWKSTMPDGSRYNGRFNLTNDIEEASWHDAVPEVPRSMANFYGVTVEEYVIGQLWAEAHLSEFENGPSLSVSYANFRENYLKSSTDDTNAK